MGVSDNTLGGMGSPDEDIQVVEQVDFYVEESDALETYPVSSAVGSDTSSVTSDTGDALLFVSGEDSNITGVDSSPLSETQEETENDNRIDDSVSDSSSEDSSYDDLLALVGEWKDVYSENFLTLTETIETNSNNLRHDLYLCSALFTSLIGLLVGCICASELFKVWMKS